MRVEKLDVFAEENTSSNNTPNNPLGSRKRKSPSVTSGRASGPSRYRPRTMVVVSYDGDIQKSFENLVRGLATGRNMLRKAKMEARMAELAAIAGSSEDEDEDEEENIVSKISYRPRITSIRARAAARGGAPYSLSSGPVPPAVLFETTDKTLEQAQELCEKSAHLTLRDGDCRSELRVVRMHLEHVLSTARTEVTKSTTNQPQTAQTSQDQDTSDTSVSSMEPSYKRHFPSISAPRPGPEPESNLEPATTPSNTSAPTTAAAAVTAPKTMDIEVDNDDDEDEELEFVMPPVRFTSRRAARA